MNKDIRISVGLPRHPKMIKLCRKVGEGGFRCLITLWCFAAENRPNGDLSGMDNADIAIASGWDKDEFEWVDALLSIGFLDATDRGPILHDWEENNPWVAGAEQRSEKARAAARARHAKQDHASCNAPSMNEQCSEQDLAEHQAGSSIAPFLTLPSPVDSEANASGAEAPDLKAVIFGPFLNWLAEKTGKPRDSLRSALGRQCKLYGDPVVIDIAMKTQKESPVDPLAWMEASFRKHGERGQRRAPRQPGEVV